MPGSPACKGQIVVSKDGGRDWSVELSSPMLMDDLAFAGRLNGWATAGGPSQDGCGPPTVPCGDEVLKSSTSNGGLVWRGVKALRGSPAAFLALSGSAAVVSDDTCKYGIWICHASVLATQDGGRTWNKVRTPPGLVVGLARWPGEIIALELVNLPRYEQQYGGRLGAGGIEVIEMPLAGAPTGGGPLPPRASFHELGMISVDQPLQSNASVQFVADGPGAAVATVSDPLQCGPHGTCPLTVAWTSDWGGSWSTDEPGSGQPVRGVGCPVAYSLAAGPPGDVAIGEASNPNCGGAMPFGAIIASYDGGASFTTIKQWPRSYVGEISWDGRSVYASELDSLLVGTVPSGAAKARPWEQLTPSLQPVQAITWVGRRDGVGFGSATDDGSILRTTDGGRTWSQIGDVPAYLASGGFSGRVGYAVALTLPLSGARVRAGYPPPGSPASSLATAPQDRQYLLRTNDGGVHWVVVNELAFADKPGPGDEFNSICPQGDAASLAVSSPQRLQIGENPLASCLDEPGLTGDEAPIWSSKNEGASFVAASTVIGPANATVSIPPSLTADGAGLEVIGTTLYMRSAPASPWRDIGVIPGMRRLSLTGFDCVNARVSFVDLQGESGGVGELLTTIDGGRTWTAIATPAGVEGTPSFATATDGAVFGDGGTYLTTNGGMDWQSATPPPS